MREGRRQAPRARALTSIIWATLLGACCSTPEPIFPPVEPMLVWPQEDDTPRYAYVGKIGGEADLKKPRSCWRWFLELLRGPDIMSSMKSAFGVAVTPERVLYVSDPEAHAVHRLDLERREYRLLTDAGEGRSFHTPIGLALLGEKLLVTDRALRTVTVLSADGQAERVLGQGQLDGPVGVAVDPAGRIHVVDVSVHKVKVFDADGQALLEYGGPGTAPGKFNFPTHVACAASGEVYVTDSLSSRVQVFDGAGQFVRSWGRRGDMPGDFSQPKGIACDSGGRVYVVDSHFENVQVFTPAGELLLAFGREGNDPGEFWLPVGICADAQDHVWVADSFHRQVQVFRYLGDSPAGETP